MPSEAHVVMVMADDSDYPSRVFESLIEAKAFAMGKQERSGTRVYVTSVPLVRAAHDGELADPTAITPNDLKTMVIQEDPEERRHCARHGYTARDDICDCPFCQECGEALSEDERCQGCEDAPVGMTVVHDEGCPHG